MARQRGLEGWQAAIVRGLIDYESRRLRFVCDDPSLRDGARRRGRAGRPSRPGATSPGCSSDPERAYLDPRAARGAGRPIRPEDQRIARRVHPRRRFAPRAAAERRGADLRDRAATGMTLGWGGGAAAPRRRDQNASRIQGERPANTQRGARGPPQIPRSPPARPAPSAAGAR